MPYALRKAPNRNLYWVVNTDTGKKHSIEPIPEDRAKKQMRLLRAIKHGFIPSRNYRLKGGLSDLSCVYYTGEPRLKKRYSVNEFINLIKEYYPQEVSADATLDDCLKLTGGIFFFNCANAKNLGSKEFYYHNELPPHSNILGYCFEEENEEEEGGPQRKLYVV